MTRPDEDEEIDDFPAVSEEDQARLILKGQDAQSAAIRQAIGDKRFADLKQEINEAAADPLQMTPRDQWTVDQELAAYGEGRLDYGTMSEKGQRELDRRYGHRG